MRTSPYLLSVPLYLSTPFAAAGDRRLRRSRPRPQQSDGTSSACDGRTAEASWF